MGTRRLPARLVAGVSVVCFTLVAVVLSLSDRAPVAYRNVRQALMALAGRVQDRAGLDLVHRDDIPIAADRLGHVVLWFAGAVVVGWATRRRVDRTLVGAALLGVGIVLELLQAVVTTSRHLEAADALANCVGITLGLVAVGVVDAVVSRVRSFG